MVCGLQPMDIQKTGMEIQGLHTALKIVLSFFLNGRMDNNLFNLFLKAGPSVAYCIGLHQNQTKPNKNQVG